MRSLSRSKNNIYWFLKKLMFFNFQKYLGFSKMDKKNVQKSIFQKMSPKKHVL